jgi:hypothetical protein
LAFKLLFKSRERKKEGVFMKKLIVMSLALSQALSASGYVARTITVACPKSKANKTVVLDSPLIVYGYKKTTTTTTTTTTTAPAPAPVSQPEVKVIVETPKVEEIKKEEVKIITETPKIEETKKEEVKVVTKTPEETIELKSLPVKPIPTEPIVTTIPEPVKVEEPIKVTPRVPEEIVELKPLPVKPIPTEPIANDLTKLEKVVSINIDNKIVEATPVELSKVKDEIAQTKKEVETKVDCNCEAKIKFLEMLNEKNQQIIELQKAYAELKGNNKNDVVATKVINNEVKKATSTCQASAKVLGSNALCDVQELQNSQVNQMLFLMRYENNYQLPRKTEEKTAEKIERRPAGMKRIESKKECSTCGKDTFNAQDNAEQNNFIGNHIEVNLNQSTNETTEKPSGFYNFGDNAF